METYIPYIIGGVVLLIALIVLVRVLRNNPQRVEERLKREFAKARSFDDFLTIYNKAPEGSVIEGQALVRVLQMLNETFAQATSLEEYLEIIMNTPVNKGQVPAIGNEALLKALSLAENAGHADWIYRTAHNAWGQHALLDTAVERLLALATEDDLEVMESLQDEGVISQDEFTAYRLRTALSVKACLDIFAYDYDLETPGAYKAICKAADLIRSMQEAA